MCLKIVLYIVFYNSSKKNFYNIFLITCCFQKVDWK